MMVQEKHLKTGERKFSTDRYAQDIAKFDITLSVTEHAGKHTMNWEYCKDLYREESSSVDGSKGILAL